MGFITMSFMLNPPRKPHQKERVRQNQLRKRYKRWLKRCVYLQSCYNRHRIQVPRGIIKAKGVR